MDKGPKNNFQFQTFTVYEPVGEGGGRVKNYAEMLLLVQHNAELVYLIPIGQTQFQRVYTFKLIFICVLPR
jgi:hypothetical protein